VARLYDEVKAYKRPDWTIAAFYRQAYLLEQFARTIYDAPVPRELGKPGQEEYLAEYQDQLARFARPYEDQAVEVYEKALEAARDLHVRNEWTARIRQSLARHRPKDHPVLREVRGRLAGPVAQGDSIAEGAARATLARDPGNVPALVALAMAFEAQGRPEAARTVLESARQEAPDDATVWNRLGLVHRTLGDGQRALESWRKASELRPDLVDALVNQGLALVEAEDHAAAQPVLERAVQIAPGHAAAWLDLGNAYRGAGRADAARRAYESALSADPGMADAWFNLGVLALDGHRADVPDTTRLEQALECFDRSVAAGGSDAAAGAYRAEAQSLLARERRRASAGDGSQRAGKEAASVPPPSSILPAEAR
jgi:tetratricopeptide (TPR) repeat protein